MDLAAKKAAREERITKKRDAIKAQQEAIAPTETDVVAETAPAEETVAEEKK